MPWPRKKVWDRWKFFSETNKMLLGGSGKYPQVRLFTRMSYRCLWMSPDTECLAYHGWVTCGWVAFISLIRVRIPRLYDMISKGSHCVTPLSL